MNRPRIAWLIVWFCAASAAAAATLPPHDPLRILIVSDGVNPHGLPDDQLTQPGDLPPALAAAGSGLNLDPAPDALVEVATNAIEDATALLAVPPGDPAAYDVLVYFSHRIPDNGMDAPGRQAAFDLAVEAFLEAGGGMVVFHHGAYLTAGKEGIQETIGATATGAVPWNTLEGQDVINVAPEHFVTCNAVTYTGTTAYADPGRGVPAGSYPVFNNTPDERYPAYEINPTADDLEVLFGSDYVDNGSTHLLGFTHRRPGWNGVVVAYQPGEHQPTALDLGGPNFQILANAVVYAARRVPADGIRLAVDRGPGAGDVTLDWVACSGNFAVLRSSDPGDVGDAANALGTTAGQSWLDTPPVAPVVHYLVTRSDAL